VTATRISLRSSWQEQIVARKHCLLLGLLVVFSMEKTNCCLRWDRGRQPRRRQLRPRPNRRGPPAHALTEPASASSTIRSHTRLFFHSPSLASSDTSAATLTHPARQRDYFVELAQACISTTVGHHPSTFVPYRVRRTVRAAGAGSTPNLIRRGPKPTRTEHPPPPVLVEALFD